MRMQATLWCVLVVLLTVGVPLRLCAETEEHQSKGYHFTRQATYLYTDFLEGDDATTLGLETDATFRLGDLHARHIMYFEVMDYPRPIPGKFGQVPAGDTNAFEEAGGLAITPAALKLKEQLERMKMPQ